jgi:uncharacterized OsmC-like protein
VIIQPKDTTMHNVNVEAVEQTAARAAAEPSSAVNHVAFAGEWQTTPGAPQFRATIPVPNGDSVTFEADYPPPMGGNGAAPNPLAYCFWGGLACYAMTYAQEAARRGVELRGLRARIETDVDLSRALGVSDRPPVEGIDWHLEVDADASPEVLEELRIASDEHCPGAFCIRNPIELRTHVSAA